MGMRINLKNMARQLQAISRTCEELVYFDDESEEWKWKDDHGDVWANQYGNACMDFEEMAAVLEAMEKVPEERKAGIKLLTGSDILHKYDIEYDVFQKMSKSSLFPKHYEYDGAWLYVETEIRTFLKNMEHKND